MTRTQGVLSKGLLSVNIYWLLYRLYFSLFRDPLWCPKPDRCRGVQQRETSVEVMLWGKRKWAQNHEFSSRLVSLEDGQAKRAWFLVTSMNGKCANRVATRAKRGVAVEDIPPKWTKTPLFNLCTSARNEINHPGVDRQTDRPHGMSHVFSLWQPTKTQTLGQVSMKPGLSHPVAKVFHHSYQGRSLKSTCPWCKRPSSNDKSHCLPTATNAKSSIEHVHWLPKLAL